MNQLHATPSAAVGALKLLHVGCGPARPEKLPAYFRSPQWQEFRLDIDPEVHPDIIGSITDLTGIADHSFDALWSSHNLEHLHWFEVPNALSEFRRVLKLDGFALISTPDLRAVARHILDDQLTDTLYESPAGPITALDIVFGHQGSLACGNHYMAHKTGFTSSTLGQALSTAGFDEVRVHEGQRWDLWAIATMTETDHAIFERLAWVVK